MPAPEARGVLAARAIFAAALRRARKDGIRGRAAPSPDLTARIGEALAAGATLDGLGRRAEMPVDPRGPRMDQRHLCLGW
jgi:hypothetical protein